MTIDAVPYELIARLRLLCLAFPEAYEEPAWTGTRWRVRARTFAHALTITNGWPPAYARAASTDEPAHVVMLRSTGAELDMLRHAGHPFFATPWRSDEIGMNLTTDTDWIEVAELITESYRTRAPRRLASIAIGRSSWTTPPDDGDTAHP